MYRYTFSFRFKLTALLFQKLATFYMWILKGKNDGEDQNIPPLLYLSKLIICYWISLRLANESQLEI